MQLVTSEINGYLANSSMIRRMFEAGLELRKKYGADNVYDFSIGNPDLPPPPEVQKALTGIAADSLRPFSLGYMPNAGYPELRARLAAKLSIEQKREVPADHVIMTCGAAGGLNVFFRTVLEAGDEVLVPSPYFVEYGFYAGNFGGKLIPVPTLEPDFRLNIDAMRAAFTPRTRAVIINNPNNPTGRIYTREELEALAALVREKTAEYDRAIYVISDEPYRVLNYGDREVESIFATFDCSVIVGSYSKSLSLAGERLGYLAVSPAIADVQPLLGGLVMANRILGFVNAPAIAQQILLQALDAQVELAVYRRRRDLMADVLTRAGVEFSLPQGAFYFFPKSPVPDERIFVEALLAEHVLAVPGRGFGLPGYLRFAFCVEDKVIINSADAIARAVRKVRGC